MKDYIEKRAVELAQYIVENNATVRKTAKIFNISKSTVHKDVHERLYKINHALQRSTGGFGAEQGRTSHSWGYGNKGKIFA